MIQRPSLLLRKPIVSRKFSGSRCPATGEYFFHLRQRAPNPRARDTDLQDQLIAACERISSIRWPV
jgi:hypothetical protein